MSQLPAGLSDAPFVGYTFRASPVNQPRLWFLERQLVPLLVWGQHYLELDIGQWTCHIPPDKAGKNYPSDDPHEVMRMAMPGLLLRYEHWGVKRWTACWKLTEVTIGHVHTFGDDDTWRLGIWPD